MEFNFERDIYLFGEINEMTVFKVIERLNLLNRYDEEMSRNGPRNFKVAPISLYINSGGGGIYAGMSLYSAIKNSPTPVITVGMGMVGSAALLVFLGGKYRISYPHTTFLFHSPKWGTLNSTPYQVENFNEYYIRMYKQLIKITQKECNLPQAIINKVYKEDFQLYMTPEQALSVGICDAIYDLEELVKKQEEENKTQKEIIDMIKQAAVDAKTKEEEEIKAKEEEKVAEPVCPEKEEKNEEKEFLDIEKKDSNTKDLDEVIKEIEEERTIPKKVIEDCDCEDCKRKREK